MVTRQQQRKAKCNHFKSTIVLQTKFMSTSIFFIADDIYIDKYIEMASSHKETIQKQEILWNKHWNL